MKGDLERAGRLGSRRSGGWLYGLRSVGEGRLLEFPVAESLGGMIWRGGYYEGRRRE